MTTRVEDLLRELAPQVLGALVRRYGHFDVAEDAAQEASLAAALQWPVDGVPQEPRTWLIRVASRKMIDLLRNERARRNREEVAAARVQPAPVEVEDDSLVLLYMCCHPELGRSAQVPLTLRAVGGLTTAEIARAFLVPEPTMAQRISRAKQRIRASGVPFRLPAPDDRDQRLDAVLQTLYLIFNEGYTDVYRAELAAEAVRLTRMARRLEPADPEISGLLALMLLTDARRPARIDADGALVPMAEQDRSRWNRAAIDEGTDLITRTMSAESLGPYQIQAAIAAVHAEAAHADDTDWTQILALYVLLERMGANPVVTLNRAVATAMTHGARAGLALLRTLDADPQLARDHRLDAVRGHLLELAGDPDRAVEHYRAAAGRTTSRPEQRYLEAKAAKASADAARGQV
jgi:RNA polymerase sigma factor (sigma-70 family)